MFLFQLNEVFQKSVMLETRKTVALVLASRGECVSVFDKKEGLPLIPFPVHPALLAEFTSNLQVLLTEESSKTKQPLPRELTEAKTVYESLNKLAEYCLRNVPNIEPQFMTIKR